MKSIKTTRALGAFFVAALTGLAISGCGSGVPGNAVVNVAGNPITTSAFNHWLYVYAVFQSSQSPGAPVIVPDAPNSPTASRRCARSCRRRRRSPMPR
jgi:hypothetical protein